MSDENKHNRIKESYLVLQKKLEPFLTKRNQRILFIVTLLMAALSIIDVIFEIFPLPIGIAVYVLAAVSLFSSLPLWIRAVKIFFKVVWLPLTERNEILGTFIQDYRLRTVVTALPGLGMNLIFAVFNAVIGITSRSAWYGSLAAYYILLCIMRFLAVMYAKSVYIDKKEMSREQRELKVYKNCGILLSVMSIVLMGAVIMLLHGVGGKSYPKILTIAVAAYTFYKLTMSIINMVRARREKSPLAVTLRHIGHSEALVALLSLQTALFTAFGQNSKEIIPIMNAATGAVVCLAALIIGIHMLLDGKKRLKQIKETNCTGGTEHD